ncbi:MAG: hypothetical protein GC147_05795 [Porphyrobacter sp.]|nr:hypothetical protein [Porphyrobacter sp.]
MRALFKALLKGSGTPVLQTVDAAGETILSAGNIWTSAHARRIALREGGLEPGGVLCSAQGGFAAVIDLVACAIGGFTVLPLSTAGCAVLRSNVSETQGQGGAQIAFTAAEGGCTLHLARLPAALAQRPGALLAVPGAAADPLAALRVFTGAEIERELVQLAQRLSPVQGGARLSYRSGQHDTGLVCDLLLAMTCRQTIYLRDAGATDPRTAIAEMIDLAVDEVAMPPAMREAVAREARRAGPAERAVLSRIRVFSEKAQRGATRGSAQVSAERLVPAPPQPKPAASAQLLVPLF